MTSSGISPRRTSKSQACRDTCSRCSWRQRNTGARIVAIGRLCSWGISCSPRGNTLKRPHIHSGCLCRGHPPTTTTNATTSATRTAYTTITKLTNSTTCRRALAVRPAWGRGCLSPPPTRETTIFVLRGQPLLPTTSLSCTSRNVARNTEHKARSETKLHGAQHHDE